MMENAILFIAFLTISTLSVSRVHNTWLYLEKQVSFLVVCVFELLYLLRLHTQTLSITVTCRRSTKN